MEQTKVVGTYSMIQFSGLRMIRGTKVLLEQTDATVFIGHKVGLIGANGCGKSSLFALIRGEIESDLGYCKLPQEWRIVSVAQETPAVERSAIDYVIDGDKRLRQLQSQLEQAEQVHDGQRIAELHGKLQDAGAYEIEARAATILNGLGFANEQLRNPVSAFSGGWRMRLNLAQALLCPSDLLLLDEPTNHLDLDAVIWLEKWIQRYTGTLMLISHDKAFLDACVSHIMSVEQQELVTYTGNYTSYEKQRAERIRLQGIQYQKQQDKVAHLESFINRFKAKASKAKQAQSRIKQLEKMQMIMPAHQASAFSFSFYAPTALPNPLVKMEEVKVGYGEKIILEKLHLNLVPGSRIGLLGRNGAGKSTLIKLLAEQMKPLSGIYETSAGLKIGYFAQHQLEFLDADSTPLNHLQLLDKQETEQKLRDYLGGFGFRGDEALSKVAPMSGGEKARLVLALLVYQKPNLLLLDEPTNHLDIEMRHALNVALQAFEGAMVLVSHDRFLLNSVCDEFYLVDSQQVQTFKGDLDDYKAWLMQSESSLAPTSSSSSKSPSSGPNRKQEKQQQAAFRQATQALRKRITEQEKQMQKLEQQLQKIETDMSDPELYTDDQKDRLKALLTDQTDCKQSLQTLEEQWLMDQESLDEQQQAFEQQMAS